MTAENSVDLQEFVRTVIYGGKQKETYVQTRTRLYKRMKNKSSLGLPPDQDYLLLHLRRAHLQSLIWYSSGLETIENLNPDNFSWVLDEETDAFKPVWFVGPQLPPSLQRRKKKLEKSVEITGVEGDEELSDCKGKKQKLKECLERRKTLLDVKTRLSDRKPIMVNHKLSNRRFLLFMTLILILKRKVTVAMMK